MGRRPDEEKVRVHVWLYKRDLERIEALWGGKLRQSDAIRLIIRRVLNQVENAASKKIGALPSVDLNLEE